MAIKWQYAESPDGFAAYLRPLTMRWRAFYSLDRDEHEPIADAAASFPAADNYLVVRMDVPGGEIVGDSQLSFDLSAENNEELVAEAERIFTQLRERAGLKPVRKRVLAFAPVVRPPWERALEKALKRDMAGLHEEAVVFAHVACETRGTAALRSLLVQAGVDVKLRNGLSARRACATSDTACCSRS